MIRKVTHFYYLKNTRAIKTIKNNQKRLSTPIKKIGIF